MILDVDDEARLRLLSSAVRYARGRRTYVVPAVARMVETNAPRLTVADRRTLASELDAAAGEQGVGDPVCDAPAWKHARTLMSSTFRHDMGIPGRATPFVRHITAPDGHRTVCVALFGADGLPVEPRVDRH